MMKINIAAVGRVKEEYYAAGIAEYLKRLTRFADVSITEVREERSPHGGAAEIADAVKKEGERLMPLLKGKVVALAIEGKTLSSEKFAEETAKIKDAGGEITFVIGGSYGLSDEVKGRADELLSFSPMTFPHALARLMLVEQIYRAFMLNAGAQYHK